MAEPSIDYSKYGATPDVDYEKYGATEEGKPTMLDKIFEGIGKIPEAIGNIATKNPKRTLQNIMTGLPIMGQNIVNMPHELLQSVLPKGVEQLLMAPTAAYNHGKPLSSFPHVDDVTPTAQHLMGTEKPDIGDKVEQQFIANLLPIAGVSKLATGGAKALIGNAKVARAGSELKGSEEAKNIAEAAHGEASSAQKVVKDAAEQEIGSSSPNRIQYNIDQKNQALEEANAHHEQLKQNMAQLPAVETGNEEKALAETRNHLNQANEIHNATDMAATKAEKDIQDALNLKANHRVENAKILQKAVKVNEDHYADRYKSLLKNVKDSNFEMPEDELKQTEISTEDFKKRYQLVAGQMRADPTGVGEELSHVLSKAPTSSDKSVRQFLDKYKDFRDSRNDLIKDLRNVKSSSERSARLKAYDDSAPLEKTIQNSLEKGMGDYLPEFREINEGYSKTVYPLRNNPIVRQAQRAGKLSPNMAEALSGEPEGQAGVGQNLVRKIANHIPQFSRNIVAQSYRANPKNLENPSATLQPYLAQHPDVDNLIKYHQGLENTANNARQTIVQAEQNHKLAQDAFNEKSSQLGKTSKDRIKLEKDLNDQQKEIKDHQVKLDKLKKHLDSLNSARNKMGMTLKEKMAAEDTYKKALVKYNETQNNIKKLINMAKIRGTQLGKAGLGVMGIKALYHLLSPSEEGGREPEEKEIEP
jgi:hypothetical protein